MRFLAAVGLFCCVCPLALSAESASSTCPNPDAATRGLLAKEHLLLQFQSNVQKRVYRVETDAGSDFGQLPSACQAVMSVQAGGQTCGQQLTYMKRQFSDLSQALAQLSIQFPVCNACWPWPKYKQAGDNSVSPKRGIALQNKHMAGGSLQALKGAISWGYVWATGPREGGPTLADWRASGIAFIPMVWGQSQLSVAQSTGLPPSKVLLGFNEPNFPSQSNLSPAQAAALWPSLQRLAAAAGIPKIVSPAVNFAQIDPITWLQQFFGNCTGCQVDAIGLHDYSCYAIWLQQHVNMYKQFGKKLWLTEFACADSAERQNMAGQMAYMREAIPMLEADPAVESYAWFSYFQDQWGMDSGLVRNGVLSDLGKLYASFATVNTAGATTTAAAPAPPPAPATTTKAPAPSPATTVACHTAVAGEACYNDVTWAKNTGVTTNPGWYPGLTASSSLSAFQSFFYTEGTNNKVCPWPPCSSTAAPVATSTTTTSARTTTTTTQKATTTTTTTQKATTTTTTTTSTRTTTTTTRKTATTTTTSTQKAASSCHTSVSGEACFKDVTWALQTGIKTNPGWYPGLTTSSSFRAFQTFFYTQKTNNGVCPWPPCP